MAQRTEQVTGEETIRLSISDYQEFSPESLPPFTWFRPYKEREPIWAVYVPHDAWVFETFPKRPGYWRQYSGPFYLCIFPNGRMTAISEKVMMQNYQLSGSSNADVEEREAGDELRFGMVNRRGV